MLFWVVVAVVAVALLGLAWWSSGRSRLGGGSRQRAVDDGTASGRVENWRNNNHTGGGMLGGGGGF